ncbi:MAG: MATE family efflux transporter [Butyrivibrio sp.]|nr:MATE family efflux transporter [Butyrivibrio sp.]
MGNKNDLTTGSVSSKFLGFFFPMLLTNLLQQIYSVADTAIVGKGIGDNALGAVGNLASLSFFIIGFSMGITNGFAVIIGQHYGSDDKKDLKKAIAMSIELSGIIAIMLTIVGCIILKPIVLLMHTDKVILNECLTYGYIIFAGLIVTIAYNLFSGILRSLGDSRTPFIAIIVSSGVNIVLDYILIFIFHTGVGGAAAATVFAQAISAMICFEKIRHLPEASITPFDFHPDSKMSFLLMKNGAGMALMNSITAIGSMVVQGFVNKYGVTFTSAYSVCTRYLNLFMLPALTAGFAVSAFVSQNFGAKLPKRIMGGVKVGIGIAFVSYILLGSIMLFMPQQLAGFMLNADDTILLASGYLRKCGIFLILLNLLFIFRSAVQGMGYPFIPMMSGFAEMALRIAVIILLLHGIGFNATAIADAVAWVGALALNAISFFIYYKKMAHISF